MRLYVFSVRDIKADSFGQPFYSTSKGQAVRSFSDEVNRAAQDNLLYQHPEDFELFILGEFDTDDGVFHTTRPLQVSVGSSVAIRN